MQYQRSSALFKAAQNVIPGGVNSPVRAFKAVGGTPIFVERAKGAYLYDADDNQLIDYIASWGPMILGHANEKIEKAVATAIKTSLSFGAPAAAEVEIAELICNMMPSIEKVRMVNSGTEATMSAIRVARGYTGRDKIIKMEGHYHGHGDSFLIAAGSGAITMGHPDSPGVTLGTAKDTLLATYNNLDSVAKLFEANPLQIACVIVEPVAGNMGCIPPQPGFLEGLRDLCDTYKSILVFDEVMTGFRLAKGGVQELSGVNADIICFGKVIGGGLPVGAFAARHEIMSYLAPLGPVYQAGTLSGNPLAMAAGFAMLKALDSDKELFDRLAKKTAYLHKGIARVLSAHQIEHTINRIGSMISVHFSKIPVVDFETASLANNERFKNFFHGMLAGGIYIAPSAYETWFITDALTYKDLDYTIDAVEKVAKTL